jgi:hypothetical protein
MTRLSVVLISAVLGAVIAAPAAAQWKWRDKGGQMQYSDLPPPAGVADRDILQRPDNQHPSVKKAPVAASASAASAASAPAKTVDPELEARRRKAGQEEAARHKADEDKLAAARAANCARAKGYQRTLDNGMRIARVNDKGEREILDDKQRAEEAKRTREVITSDCK